MERQLRKGIIKEYNAESGFGFITDDKTKRKYFFHINDIVNKFNIIPKKRRLFSKVARIKNVCVH